MLCYPSGVPMNKRDLIDQIRRLNPSALAEFLATFDKADLLAYLYQLQELERERREQTGRELTTIPA